MPIIDELIEDGNLGEVNRCYRVGGETTTTYGDYDVETTETVPLIVNLEQPGWPGVNTAGRYRRNALMLISEMSPESYHLIIGEIVRAIDCRLSEILYFLGLYPESDWVNQDRQLSISKKLRLSKRVLPRIIVPQLLIRNITLTRNLAEHQYDQPQKEDVHKAHEVMELFFAVGANMYDIISNFSCFLYELPARDKKMVVQIKRDVGGLLICEYGQPDSRENSVASGHPDAKRMLNKITSDIQARLDLDAGFMRSLGII